MGLWKHHYEQSECSVQFSRVRLSATLCSTPGLPVHHQLPEFTQTHVIESVMPSSHLILCHPLLLLPQIPPSIRVFSNGSTLRMRWPKYWSFSFSIVPFKEIPGLISFRMDWLVCTSPIFIQIQSFLLQLCGSVINHHQDDTAFV